MTPKLVLSGPMSTVECNQPSCCTWVLLTTHLSEPPCLSASQALSRRLLSELPDVTAPEAGPDATAPEAEPTMEAQAAAAVAPLPMIEPVSEVRVMAQGADDEVPDVVSRSEAQPDLDLPQMAESKLVRTTKRGKRAATAQGVQGEDPWDEHSCSWYQQELCDWYACAAAVLCRPPLFESVTKKSWQPI